MSFISQSVGNVIIPADALIFFRGVETYHQPDIYIYCSIQYLYIYIHIFIHSSISSCISSKLTRCLSLVLHELLQDLLDSSPSRIPPTSQVQTLTPTYPKIRLKPGHAEQFGIETKRNMWMLWEYVDWLIYCVLNVYSCWYYMCLTQILICMCVYSYWY